MDLEHNTQPSEIKEGNRTIKYYLRPAAEPDKPIIFIFHGHGSSRRPSRFRSKEWNIVCPMDEFGIGGFGSWFLGEGGDFFWIRAIHKIISEVRKIVGQGDLYCWGTSMGGYAAILHGYLNNAKAVYANVPQTVLLNSNYSEKGMRRYFEPIFEGTSTSIFNDLKEVVSKPSQTVYFLCFNQLEHEGTYFVDQALPFVTHLHALKQRLYLEVRPSDAHGLNHGMSESLELFNKFLTPTHAPV